MNGSSARAPSSRCSARRAATTGVDDDFAARGFANLGAWILGRNMFGPVRGPWPDESWKGWWGDNRRITCPVFVLTHHPRAPLEMEGGTISTSSPAASTPRSSARRTAAGGKDVRLGGGAATIRQYLRAGLIDELHLAIAPVLLGAGEPLFAGHRPARARLSLSATVTGDGATHVVLSRTGP